MKQWWNVETSIETIKEDQKRFKSDLNQITTGNPKCKKEYKLNTIKNNKNLYNSRKNVINFF